MTIRQWRVHLGAHKTATTHIQDTLAAHRLHLRAAGVDYLPLPEIREVWLYARLRAAGRLRGVHARLRKRATRRTIMEAVAPLRHDLGTLVLSEENLLGSVAGALAPRLYPGAERIVHVFRSLEGESSLAFCLAIRSPETLLPSAYVQYLRHYQPPPGGFAAIRAWACARPPRWAELVRRLRRAAGPQPIAVWRYEEYSVNRNAIIGEICGREISGLPQVPVPSHTRRVSAAAVAAAEALPAGLPLEERRRRVASIFAASPPDAPPFAPFTADERALLAESYRRDVAEIAGERQAGRSAAGWLPAFIPQPALSLREPMRLLRRAVSG